MKSSPPAVGRVRREIKWLRPPPSLPPPHNAHNNAPSDALSHLTYDVLTLLLGWLGPHEALRAAAVSKAWQSALAHAQWRVITLVAKADPRPTSLQLTAILAPQCINDSLQVLRLRMVTAGSFVWHDPAARIPALQHCRRLRRLELTEVDIPLPESVITCIAAGCAASLEEVHINHGMSVHAMVALLCCPKMRRLRIRTVHGNPLDAYPAGLPWDAARQLESFRCGVGEAPLDWLALFTPPKSASMRDFELLGSFSCRLQESLQPLVDFLGALVSIAEEVRRLRLPTLSCSLLPHSAHLDRNRQTDEARTALRSYPFVTISTDSSHKNTIILGVQKEDDCPIVTAMAGLTTGDEDEESLTG
jgi:hypothetical protein